MRLICPNCDAEYQVDDAAIPEAGRDVQCSNCGHAWFQRPVEAENALEAEEALHGGMADAETEVAATLSDDPAPAVSDPVTASGAEVSSPDLNGPDMDGPDLSSPDLSSSDIDGPDIDGPDMGGPVMPSAGPVPDLASEPPKAAEPSEPEETPKPVGSRQTIAESVLSVLREEAERETASRRDESPAPRPADAPGSMETQTEFGLEQAAQSSGAGAAARHIARLKGVDPELPAVAEPKAAARRDLLPDIEEINSTLRAESDRAAAQMEEIDALPDIRPRRRGFRSGFMLMMVIAVALAMAYVMAPRIIAQMPAAAPGMRAYVASVDQARLWLDSLMKSASGTLRSIGGDGT